MPVLHSHVILIVRFTCHNLTAVDCSCVELSGVGLYFVVAKIHFKERTRV